MNDSTIHDANAGPALETERHITPVEKIADDGDAELTEVLFDEFVRATRKRKQSQRLAFKLALRKFAGSKLAAVSTSDPIMLMAPSPESDARELDRIVSVQFLEHEVRWGRFSQFMEVNVHSMVNGVYEVDRIYWNFPASAAEQCNELIKLVYASTGSQFEAVFSLVALDHKQVVSGMIADVDVLIDRERGGRQTRVIVDLVNAHTKQCHGGMLAHLPPARPLTEILRQSYEEEVETIDTSIHLTDTESESESESETEDAAEAHND